MNGPGTRRGVWTEERPSQVPGPGLPDLGPGIQLRRLRGQPDLSFADFLRLARGEARIDPALTGPWFAHMLWGLPRVTPLQSGELLRGMNRQSSEQARSRKGATFSLGQAWPYLIALRLAWLAADEVQALEAGPPESEGAEAQPTSDPASWLSERRASLHALMETSNAVMECGELMLDLQDHAAREGIDDLLRDGSRRVPSVYSVIRPVHFMHWGMHQSPVAWRVAAALNASDRSDIIKLCLLEKVCAADQPPGPHVYAAAGPLNHNDTLITTSRADPALILAAVEEQLAAGEERRAQLSPGLKAALGACNPVFQALTCLPGMRVNLAATQLTTLTALLALGPEKAQALTSSHALTRREQNLEREDPTGLPELTALLLTHPSAHTPTLEAIRAALGPA